ncbi:tyrosine-type recombinase/integrase [Tissierella praeacuta]|uniref:tyrosine-type recombinase/integrase n=1 Tax=Tissierella praeacuta TaxID=43131 RepID=UPI0028A7042D|nr:tyrosine-type recombinase/integrase [Tissierella praeacuta]
MKQNNDFFQTLRGYLTVFLPSQKCCSKNTCKSYREVLNSFVDYLEYEKGLGLRNISFELFNETLVLEFLDWLQSTRHLSASTRNHRLMVLRSFFKYAGMVDCAQIDIHMKLKKIPTQNAQGKIVEFLSEDALKTLLIQPEISKSSEYRNMVFMTLMYDSAARCSEMLDLRVQDLRLDSRHPTVYLTGKGNKTRLVPLMLQTARHCEQYLAQFHPEPARKGSDYFFFTVSHGERHRMSPDNAAYFMKKYGEQAQLMCPEVPSRVHPHQLRHTRAIHLYRDGMPLALLSEFMGHANVETTKIYAYADTEMKRAAIQKGEKARGAILNTEPIWKDDDAILRKLCGLR